jgi:hypothetical protein
MLSGSIRRPPLGGDYDTARLLMLVVGLLLVGGRILEHLQHVADDPLLQRFLRSGEDPVGAHGRELKSFTARSLLGLIRLNRDLVFGQMATLRLGRAASTAPCCERAFTSRGLTSATIRTTRRTRAITRCSFISR